MAEEWRQQTEQERAIIAALLLDDFPGRDAIRAQIEDAPVALDCDCGCGSLRFLIPNDAPPAEVESHLPLDTRGEDASGNPVGAFVLMDRAKVKCLEFWSPIGEPNGLPVPPSLRPS